MTAIDFTLEELRVLAKSLSRTRDTELRKLSRLKPDTHVHRQVTEDFSVLDECDAKVSNAISEAVITTNHTA